MEKPHPNPLVRLKAWGGNLPFLEFPEGVFRPHRVEGPGTLRGEGGEGVEGGEKGCLGGPGGEVFCNHYGAEGNLEEGGEEGGVGENLFLCRGFPCELCFEDEAERWGLWPGWKPEVIRDSCPFGAQEGLLEVVGEALLLGELEEDLPD